MKKPLDSMTFLAILFALSLICQVLFLVFCIKAWREVRSRLLPDHTQPHTYDLELAKSAYLEARPKYMARDNVRAIGLKKDEAGYFFKITMREPDPAMHALHLHKLSDGSSHPIRVKTTILGSNRIKAHSPDLSAQVFDINDTPEWGTMGCLVKLNSDASGKLYLLTCCHNVVHPVSDASSFVGGSITAGTSDPQADPIGKVTKVIFDNEVDVALIAIDPTPLAHVSNNVPGMGRPGSLRSVDSSDVTNKTTASICGAKSGYCQGTITGVYDAAKIEYGSEEYQFINLITVSNNGSTIARDGDSGSVVLDKDSNVIGLVVSSQPDETYIIPMDTILTKLNIQLA